jgi:polysaccharide export outer membrane protein
LTSLAATNRVKLTRTTPEGRKTFEISVKDILEKGAEDLRLQPGDIIFVPESPI